MQERILKEYYMKYLKDIRGVSDSSVNHYTQAMRKISSFLAEKGKIHNSLYEIHDIGELELLQMYLYEDADFRRMDERGHRMYSVGLNNYMRFAKGEGFENIRERINIFDVQAPIPGLMERNVIARARSSIIKKQAIEAAGYVCEYNSQHVTFTAKSSGYPYMEGHHALPMKYQDMFNHSLDVYANIICLCPICHKLLHYGIDNEKIAVVNKIYYERADRLAQSGIRISKEDFFKLVI